VLANGWIAAAAGPVRLDVPFVRQSKYGCGAASVAMVIQYWARTEPRLAPAAADTERIASALPADTRSGLSGESLQAYLERSGFSTFVFSGEMDDLRNHLAKGRPLVVCLGLRGRRPPWHFTVVTGIDDEAVLLNDPARGKLFREDRRAFLRAWEVTHGWALLAVPRPAP
jgi:predicted double-glycine peptidase